VMSGPSRTTVGPFPKHRKFWSVTDSTCIGRNPSDCGLDSARVILEGSP
jgi:hypothetical protein